MGCRVESRCGMAASSDDHTPFPHPAHRTGSVQQKTHLVTPPRPISEVPITPTSAAEKSVTFSWLDPQFPLSFSNFLRCALSLVFSLMPGFFGIAISFGQNRCAATLPRAFPGN